MYALYEIHITQILGSRFPEFVYTYYKIVNTDLNIYNLTIPNIS